MALSPVLAHELRRKTFHLLTLAYLGAYLWLGYPRALYWMLPWTLLVGAVELARCYWPALNELALAPFRGIMREHEFVKLSGAWYTSLGALLTIACWGEHRVVVAAALVCLAVGDAAAALAGRALGRHPWPFAAPKSVEGSAACLAACLAGCLACGLGPAASLAAAAAVTLLELAPLPFNDNLWIPVGAGLVAWLAGAA